jgi:ATP-dependent DNA helicase RecQ
MIRDPLVALEKHFGFRKFLHGQERVISSILSGQDALIVMPTGGGKSLCYQLPALIMDGVTVVISPLIALMNRTLRCG